MTKIKRYSITIFKRIFKVSEEKGFEILTDKIIKEYLNIYLYLIGFFVAGFILVQILSLLNIYLITNDSTLHYLFSTLIQSDAALISILIVIFVFRKQYLDNEFNKYKTEFIFEYGSQGELKIYQFESKSLPEKKESLNEHQNDKEKKLMSNLIAIEESRIVERFHFRSIFISSIVPIMIYTFLLPLSVSIHLNKEVEQAIIIYSLALQFAFLFLIAFSILKTFTWK